MSRHELCIILFWPNIIFWHKFSYLKLLWPPNFFFLIFHNCFILLLKTFTKMLLTKYFLPPKVLINWQNCMINLITQGSIIRGPISYNHQPLSYNPYAEKITCTSHHSQCSFKVTLKNLHWWLTILSYFCLNHFC